MNHARHAALWLWLVGGLAAGVAPEARGQLPPPPPGEEALPPGVPETEIPPPAGPADPPTPAVSVRVRVAATAAPDKELTYRITAENRSSSGANHVEVRSAVPAHAAYVKATPEPAAAPTADNPKLAWKLGTLAPGARREITLVVKPDGTGDVEACARVVFEHGQCVRTRIARPDVRASRTGPAQAAPRDLVTYRLEVTNAGGGEAAGVVLTEQLPEGLAFSEGKPPPSTEKPLAWELGTLAPGQTRRVEYQAVAGGAGTHEGKTSVSVGGKVVQETPTKVTVGEPGLELTVTGPRRRSLDRPAVYRITVSNPGATPATNVRVADDLFHEDVGSDRVEFLGASAGGAQAGRDVGWSIGTLGAGARRTVELTLRARRVGTLTTVARASADRGLKARAGATTEFAPAAGLTVDLDKDRDPLPVGGEAVLTLRLRNRTASPAKVAELRVTLPGELSVVRATGPGKGVAEKQSVTFAPPDPLPPGAEGVCTVTVRGEKPGKGTIRTELSTDTLEGGAPAAPEETATVVPEGPSTKGPKEDKP